MLPSKALGILVHLFLKNYPIFKLSKENASFMKYKTPEIFPREIGFYWHANEWNHKLVKKRTDVNAIQDGGQKASPRPPSSFPL